MFIRERHKSEYFHHNISDLQRRSHILSEDNSSYSKNEEEEPKKKEITAAVFVLPSRHKDQTKFDKRPDYPESSAPFSHHSTSKLIDILDDSDNMHYKDGIYEVDSCPPGDSEV